MKTDNVLDSFEIPFDLLEGVSGGVLTEAQMSTLDSMFAFYIKTGRSKKELMTPLTEADPEKGSPTEMIAYVDERWGSNGPQQGA